ncbi:hypothetical protein FB45DRAFT_791855, partial [Roridomyces roridus]
MTRITNIGIKRDYVQAGLDAPEPETSVPETETTVPPPKKKRKRTKLSQRDGYKAEGQDGQPSKPDGGAVPKPAAVPKTAKKSKPKKDKYVSPSEARRLQRIADRNAETTCFACRSKGHSARDCPKAVVSQCCYRCGSAKHTLARCKKPTDPSNPLPFASCFVCNTKGHLASACPQNKAKGVYPNGGCCKLCGDTSHLAKDCGVRKQDSRVDSGVLGVGREAGADEDDFHTLKRRRTEVDREEKQEERFKRSVDLKAGAHSGIVKPFGSKCPRQTK